MVGDKDGSADVPTIADDLVVTKYKMAAEIVNSEWDELEMVEVDAAVDAPAAPRHHGCHFGHHAAFIPRHHG